MLHDCCLFATLKHSNINSPLGIVYKTELSPYPLIVYAYSNKGILKRLIIQNRISAREQVRILNDKKRERETFYIVYFSYYQHKNSFIWRYI
jgi:hypothetical protein